MTPFFFMQLADPQFGMFEARSRLSPEEIEDALLKGCKVIPTGPVSGLEMERDLFQNAIEEANRLRPAFVVVCGDMVHNSTDEEWDTLLDVARGLDPEIPLHWVPGNHDIGGLSVDAAQSSLLRYRERFQSNYFSFDHNGASFIVLDSTAICNKPPLLGEWEAQLGFLEDALTRAAERPGPIVVFSHHPPFLKSPDEPDDYWNMPLQFRIPLLKRLRAGDVDTVFCGHWHRNNESAYDGMDVVVSAPVGYPLAKDPSGYRIVRVSDDGLEHDYFGFGAGPDFINLTVENERAAV